jgi:hypothetical protein
MLLETKDGIGCDLCGVAAREKFTYYSAQFKKILVAYHSVSAGGVEWDIEICPGCFGSLIDRCRKFLSGARRSAVKCDLCPKYYSGVFTYFTVQLDNVTVDKDANPKTEVKENVMDFNVCTECLNSLRDSRVTTVQKPTKGNWTIGA